MVEFINMGGHGFFIWTSYTIVAVVLGYIYFSPLFKRRKLVKTLSTYYKSNPGQ